MHILTGAAAIAAALTVTSAAPAATIPSLVPAAGSVAGRDYSAWQARAWKYTLNHNDAPESCPTVTSGGRRVTLLVAAGSGRVDVACTVPAGQPLYVSGLQGECSDIEPAPFHGATPAEARTCAKGIFDAGRRAHAAVDGQRVRHYGAFATASSPFRYHLAQKVPGVHGRSGKGVAYGVGLLLKGFSAGTHTVRSGGNFPDFEAKYDFHYRLTVK